MYTGKFGVWTATIMLMNTTQSFQYNRRGGATLE
uniref:Uncharacterized protein n=1 Tax=Physcomitrium patens TaxID=3218 RepID=A0A2K1IBX0_PHYPA|nr:hypothetical protein PHYPA_030238 [Physcomitrium patens]